jgi:hypothetical protein
MFHFSVNIFILKVYFHHKEYFVAFCAAVKKKGRIQLKGILKQRFVDIEILFALIEHYPSSSHLSARAFIRLNIIPIAKAL